VLNFNAFNSNKMINKLAYSKPFFFDIKKLCNQLL
jgi:hypothetical protein